MMHAPTDTDSLTLIHFGDLHLWRYGMDGDPYLKRWLGLANLFLRRHRWFPPAVADALAERFINEQSDWILFCGDLTTTGLRAEFDAARRLFEPLRQRIGERLVAIPGNHDRYTPKVARNNLFERNFLAANQDYPFAVDLNDHWTLIALDLSRPRLISARGEIDDALLARIRDLLDRQRTRDRRLIVMGHYPLVDSPSGHHGWSHQLVGREKVLAELERAGVVVYLHGHVHKRCRIDHNGVTHINCGSAGRIGPSNPLRRAGYTQIQLGPERLESVQAVWLTNDPPYTTTHPPQWSSAELKL